ncbi:MAG: GspMb/PilO family protein [Tepidisphaeraceae bacterium]
MVLSKREKYAGIGAIAAVALLLLDQFVLSPYFDQLDTVSQATDKAVRQISDNADLVAKQIKLEKVWTEMQNGGLQVDESKADSQAQLAMLQWAQRANMVVTALKTEHVAQEKAFEVLSYDITVTGSTPGLARLIWAFETATIPLRVNEIQISSRPENTDNLTVRMNVSTLSLPETNPAGGNP